MSIEAKLKTVPDLPGAYLIKDAEGAVIYVGKARSLRKRLGQHFREAAAPGRWAHVMTQHAADLEFIVTNTELESLILEATLIKEHQPRYNIRMADDKSYPYLKLTEEMYPRLMLLRDLPKGARPGALGGRQVRRGLHDPKRHEVHKLEGAVFGPYADVRSMRRTMRLASQLFGIRSCRKDLRGEPVGKPCLNYHIKRCVGPCTGQVTEEEYAQIVRQVTMFLQGDTKGVERELKAEMDEAAEALNFEKAAALRDKLKALRRSTEEQIMVANEALDIDIIACAADEDRSLVAVLCVRAGRLVSQDQFVLMNTSGRTEGEIIEGFLTQHYSHAQQVPRLVLVSHDIENRDGWQELLGELRGSKVEIRRPQRGDKRRLVDLGLRNAQLGLMRLAEARGERAQAAAAALSELAEMLGLPEPPQRIECYDISMLQGQKSTGSQVVFADGLPDKRNYRHYRMWESEGKPDDYAMMKEMLQRRLRRGLAGDEKFLPLPDLMIMDGGKGQVSVAVTALAEAGLEIPVAGLAKSQEEVFVPGRKEPLDTEPYPRAWFLLQRIRDEAHRFASQYHRSLRDREMSKSVLDDIPGIGPRRKRELLKAFGSVQELARASVAELVAVPGMNRTVAEELLRYLASYASELEEDT